MKAKYILQILPLLLVLGMTSCSKEEATSAEEAKEYNVSLKFNGEITTADTPLTRGTATNDLIGVQVYQDGGIYAYGLFDNVDDININLFSSHKYKFEVTVVKDGKNKLSVTDSFGSPFDTYQQYKQMKPDESGYVTKYGYYYTKLDNKFQYKASWSLSNIGFSNLRSGYTNMKGHLSYYPETDRFYGEVDNYTPTENGSLTIDLKRTAFGLKYEVSGVTDGTVSVKIENSSRTFFENTEITSEYESEEKIFTFSDVYSAWRYANNYTESITVSATWARGVGITENLGSKTVQIKRNAMNIIRLKLGSVDYDGNIGIEVEEETDMDEETVTGTLE